MKIVVGIHENVILSKVLISEKGRLTLVWRQLGEKKEEVGANPFDKMNASEVVEEESGNGLILWPFKAPSNKDTKTQAERTPREMGELANGDVMRLKNQCQLILEQYMPKDQIKWSIFESTAMAAETYYEDISSQNNLDVIYKNIAEQFMAMIQPYLDKDEFAMRLKLPRQSTEKHFARLPDRYLNEQPFIEPMDVPKEQSRVKWSAYEIKEKLNDGTPVSRNTADTTGEPTPEGDNVFGQR